MTELAPGYSWVAPPIGETVLAVAPWLDGDGFAWRFQWDGASWRYFDGFVWAPAPQRPVAWGKMPDWNKV